MKFKLDDKVRVKDNGWGSGNKPITTKCRGRVGKIVAVALIDIDEYGYELDIAPNYYWSADSLEPYEEERDARRYKVGDRVIAVDNVGAHPKGAPGRIVVILNDHPDDKNFDYMVSYDDGQGALWSNIVCLEGEKVPVASPALSFVSPPVHGKQSEMEREMRYPFIAITCNGRKTKAVLKCGDEVLRRASASCHPEDDFDQYVGARIALDRLFDRPVDIDAHEHTEHPAMPKPFEGKAVCVNKNEAHPVSKRFTDTVEGINNYREMPDADVVPAAKWTFVMDGLPPEGKLVLCWYVYFRARASCRLIQTFVIGYQYGGHWIGEKADGREGVIIAWMPLPEPPV